MWAIAAADSRFNTFSAGGVTSTVTCQALAHCRGLQVLVTGVSEADFPATPIAVTLTRWATAGAEPGAGAARQHQSTPLMWRDKAAVWQLAFGAGRPGID